LYKIHAIALPFISNSKFALAGVWLALGFTGHWLEGVEHEVEEVVPGSEREVLNECPQMLEEGPSRGQLGAYGPIALVQAVENGMHQIGEDDQGRQQRG